jgi:hypothetical protein
MKTTGAASSYNARHIVTLPKFDGIWLGTVPVVAARASTTGKL